MENSIWKGSGSIPRQTTLWTNVHYMGWTVDSVSRLHFKNEHSVCEYTNFVSCNLCRILIGSFILSSIWRYDCTYIHELYLENILASDLYNRRQIYIYFSTFCFWDKPKTIKHVENDGILNVRDGEKKWAQRNFPFVERTAESNTPLHPFRKLNMRFQKNLRQINKPLCTCQMDWKLA